MNSNLYHQQQQQTSEKVKETIIQQNIIIYFYIIKLCRRHLCASNQSYKITGRRRHTTQKVKIQKYKQNF